MARRIEEETFATAAAAGIEEDDGIEILQVYSINLFPSLNPQSKYS